MTALFERDGAYDEKTEEWRLIQEAVLKAATQTCPIHFVLPIGFEFPNLPTTLAREILMPCPNVTFTSTIRNIAKSIIDMLTTSHTNMVLNMKLQNTTKNSYVRVQFYVVPGFTYAALSQRPECAAAWLQLLRASASPAVFVPSDEWKRLHQAVSLPAIVPLVTMPLEQDTDEGRRQCVRHVTAILDQMARALHIINKKQLYVVDVVIAAISDGTLSVNVRGFEADAQQIARAQIDQLYEPSVTYPVAELRESGYKQSPHLWKALVSRYCEASNVRFHAGPLPLGITLPDCVSLCGAVMCPAYVSGDERLALAYTIMQKLAAFADLVDRTCTVFIMEAAVTPTVSGEFLNIDMRGFYLKSDELAAIALLPSCSVSNVAAVAKASSVQVPANNQHTDPTLPQLFGMPNHTASPATINWLQLVHEKCNASNLYFHSKPLPKQYEDAYPFDERLVEFRVSYSMQDLAQVVLGAALALETRSESNKNKLVFVTRSTWGRDNNNVVVHLIGFTMPALESTSPTMGEVRAIEVGRKLQRTCDSSPMIHDSKREPQPEPATDWIALVRAHCRAPNLRFYNKPLSADTEMPALETFASIQLRVDTSENGHQGLARTISQNLDQCAALHAPNTVFIMGASQQSFFGGSSVRIDFHGFALKTDSARAKMLEKDCVSDATSSSAAGKSAHETWEPCTSQEWLQALQQHVDRVDTCSVVIQQNGRRLPDIEQCILSLPVANPTAKTTSRQGWMQVVTADIVGAFERQLATLLQSQPQLANAAQEQVFYVTGIATKSLTGLYSMVMVQGSLVSRQWALGTSDTDWLVQLQMQIEQQKSRTVQVRRESRPDKTERATTVPIVLSSSVPSADERSQLARLVLAHLERIAAETPVVPEMRGGTPITIATRITETRRHGTTFLDIAYVPGHEFRGRA